MLCSSHIATRFLRSGGSLRTGLCPSSTGLAASVFSTNLCPFAFPFALHIPHRGQSQSSKGFLTSQWQEGELDPRYSSEHHMRRLNPATMAHYIRAAIQNERREMGLEEVVDWEAFAKDAVYLPTRSGPLWVGPDDPRAARLMRRKAKMRVSPLQKTRPKPGPDPARTLEQHPLREYFTSASNFSDPLSVAGNLHRAGLIREADIRFTAAKIRYEPRPPVVSIMGHVDHGKTTLLDYLRETNVAAREAGGITQSIGAFQVRTAASGQWITFIDTPGHAAFTAMREVGAGANDLIVLVVSVVDGVQAQTKEVIELAGRLGVPLVVAITKMDRTNGDVTAAEAACGQIASQLRELGLDLEQDGGDVQLVQVSARTGAGIDALLEAIQLQAEICEVSTPVPSRAELRVLESRQGDQINEVAAIVQCGRVRPGQVFVAGMVFGVVKKILDEHGEMLAEAGPSTPVLLQGFRMPPKPGVSLLQVSSEKHAEKFYHFMRDVFAVEGGRENYLQLLHQEELGLFNNRKPDNNLVRAFSTRAFLVICKAATFGMLQAMLKSIYELPRLQGLSIEIKTTEIGGLTNGDVLRIGTSGQPGCLLIYGDCTDRMTLTVPSHITVLRFNVLYHGIERLKETFVEQLPKRRRVRVQARAVCGQTFKCSQAGRSGNAGGMTVTLGPLDAAHLTVRVLRKRARGAAAAALSNTNTTNPTNTVLASTEEDDIDQAVDDDHEIVYQGRIRELRRFKDIVPSVETGLECGVILYDGFRFVVGDVLEQVEVYEEPRDVAEEYEAAARREKISHETAQLQERITTQQAEIQAVEEKIGKLAETLQEMG